MKIKYWLHLLIAILAFAFIASFTAPAATYYLLSRVMAERSAPPLPYYPTDPAYPKYELGIPGIYLLDDSAVTLSPKKIKIIADELTEQLLVYRARYAEFQATNEATATKLPPPRAPRKLFKTYYNLTATNLSHSLLESVQPGLTTNFLSEQFASTLQQMSKSGSTTQNAGSNGAYWVMTVTLKPAPTPARYYMWNTNTQTLEAQYTQPGSAAVHVPGPNGTNEITSFTNSITVAVPDGTAFLLVINFPDIAWLEINNWSPASIRYFGNCADGTPYDVTNNVIMPSGGCRGTWSVYPNPACTVPPTINISLLQAFGPSTLVFDWAQVIQQAQPEQPKHPFLQYNSPPPIFVPPQQRMQSLSETMRYSSWSNMASVTIGMAANSYSHLDVQSVTNLSSTNWVSHTNLVTDLDGCALVELPTTSTEEYYRVIGIP